MRDKKIEKDGHLCNQPAERTRPQKAKLRLVQPLGVNTTTEGMSEGVNEG